MSKTEQTESKPDIAPLFLHRNLLRYIVRDDISSLAFNQNYLQWKISVRRLL